MDDGLLLNLASDTLSSSHITNSKKGGRWVDRLKAKRGEKRKAKHVDATEVSGPSVSTRPSTSGAKAVSLAEDTIERPPKRARPNSDLTPSNPQRQPGQIISSLFSSNPSVPKTTQQRSIKNTTQPSNAPLTDASTFLGLGLDPLVVTHLEKKMGISKPTSIQRASLSAILPTVASDEDVAHSRDIFIQSQTGSGKTLSYLLPIIQDLLPLSSLSYIDRSIGTLAVIIAPTRELAKQISDVLDSLLSLRLSPSTKDDGEEKDSYDGPRLTRWLISGVLVGGSTRTHEKARLRKGVPILVCTPGRLLDHLQNTSSFNIGKCRWLVLDEADRLMDLGFEESITGILKALDGRRNLAQTAVEEGKGMEVGGWDWERRRRTILCSATIREDVQKLAGTTLQKPIVVKASDVAAAAEDVVLGVAGATNPTPGPDGKFTPPSQLSQKYVVAPLKLRLVTLVALLRSILSKAQAKGDAQGAVGTGIIVFLSCTDSVDFHWALFGGSKMGADDVSSDTSDDVPDESKGADEEDDADSGTATEKGRKKRRQITSHVQIEARSSLLPDTSIFRLHGSLPLSTRQTSLRGFSSVSSTKGKERADPSAPTSAILLCTSVASRGLDLPLIRAVLQYDLPTEGGVTEYIHRIGRTARVGKGGEAWAFVGPSEVEWVPWVETKMKGEAGKELKLEPIGVEEILRKGFGGKGSEYEARATDVQLSFERWVLAQKKNADLARTAFQSHMRAYATHPSDEKHLFHVRNLHTGHLAKAFGLREAPSAVNAGMGKAIMSSPKRKQRGPTTGDRHEQRDGKSAEERMKEAVRAQGRLSKHSGEMVTSGAGEFQITSKEVLEKLSYGK